MAKFLITPEWKVGKPGEMGRVVLRLMGKDCVSGAVRRVRIKTDVTGEGASVLEERRDEIIGVIRRMYAVILRRTEAGEEFGVDEVVSDFARARDGNPDLGTDAGCAVLRADLVSLGNGFKGDFRYVYPVEENVSDFLLEYIDGLSRMAKNEGRESKSRSYSSTRRSLERYLDGEDVRLPDIDRAFVADYSDWLAGEGVARSTQSFYLRSLRSILNQAGDGGLAATDENLFEGMNTRVVFRDGDGSVPGLSRETMWRIANMDLSEDEELMAVRDMFMFAFYCKGMELRDVLNLKKECVHDGMMTYKRRSNGRVKSVILDDNAMDIIQRYLSNDGPYLFPLLSMHRGLRQYSVNGVVRRNLRQIGEMVGEPDLSFGMNIATWRSLVAQIDPAVMLRGSA